MQLSFLLIFSTEDFRLLPTADEKKKNVRKNRESKIQSLDGTEGRTLEKGRLMGVHGTFLSAWPE